MKKYSVYILKCSDDSYYVGITNDVFQREDQHNKGLDIKSYTYKRRPVKVVWHQEFLSPNEAIEKEKQLKGWSRKKKEALINNNLETLPTLSMNRKAQQHFDRLSVTNKKVFKEIMEKLPYSEPFLFVDELQQITEDGVVGAYHFKPDTAFYKGHFKNHPVTPGVILTECCAQIGLVCLGIFLINEEHKDSVQIGFTSSEMEFLKPVYPGEKVSVVSEKIYFRFQKLKCKVKMYNIHDEVVCRGVLSGMFKTIRDDE